MERKTKRKSRRLATKLKQAVQHLHVDVFGYEAKVTQNISSYFTRLSQETGISQPCLFLRIFKDQDMIHVGIYYQGRLVKKIPVTALIGLFTDIEASDIFDVEVKVSNKITSFLQELATTQKMNTAQLQICIFSRDSQVVVKAYRGIDYIEDVPLRKLIKHFMG